MKLSDINIRDPYILPYDGKYYLFGTRSTTCWGPAEGFDGYVSDDLENWSDPVEIFHRPDGFWANQNYWAPECYFYKGEFCLITTLGGTGRKKSVNLLKSDSSLGPYHYISTLTPSDCEAIDGTLYLDGEVPYLVYSFSFENGGQGKMYAVRLSPDLEKAVESPKPLFNAKEASWAVPVPFAKEEFGVEEDCYFTDGPSVYRMTDGKLAIVWSSWGLNGYTVGIAYSDSGSIYGPWRQTDKPLFDHDGGHGMFFRTYDGRLFYTMHYPDTKYKEHPVLRGLCEKNGELTLDLTLYF